MEFAYILQKDPDFFDNTVFNEWGHNYFSDNRIYFVPSTGEANEGKGDYVREQNLGFRVVRNVQ